MKGTFLGITALIGALGGMAGCSNTIGDKPDEKDAGLDDGPADGAADSDATDTTPVGGPADLDGTWEMAVNSGTGIFDYTFNADGTYEFTTRGITSATTAIEIVQKGTFVATSSTVTYTPQEASCTGPEALYSVTYSIVNSGGSEYIIGTSSSGAFAYVKVSSPTTLGGFTTTIGCLANGTFTPQQVGPVTNN